MRRKHERPLSPERIWDLTDAISEAVEDVRVQYRDAFEYAHGPKDRPTDEQDQRISTSTVSDPTGESATSQLGARRKLRNASNDLERIRDRVLSVTASIAGIFDPPDDEEWQPLAAYRTPDQTRTAAKERGEAMKQKRDLLEQEKRLEGKLEAVRRQIVQRVG